MHVLQVVTISSHCHFFLLHIFFLADHPPLNCLTRITVIPILYPVFILQKFIMNGNLWFYILDNGPEAIVTAKCTVIRVSFSIKHPRTRTP